ncbi:Ribbon-helix-helix protein, CopG family [Sporosarcina sp. ANT_H38]|uniref:hypothetical protein n=1 Tax=Sporosarcina sp. ANT_H38 TaxID=2597358 RepID=UPI00165DDF3C|nr:hypothetical protein [Sporosarcina sp. ANT_H38]
MEAKKTTINIQAKLNPEIDADLIEEIEKIPKRDRSRTYREALRFYFKHRQDKK